jgi:hypothetical protein
LIDRFIGKKREIRGMPKTNRRTGRKPQPANQGQRASLGLKVTPEIKNKLDAAAKANGRTQSQEAELRLESSFRNGRVAIEVLELAFGTAAAKFMLRVGMTIRSASVAGNFITGTMHDDLAAWSENPFIFDTVARGVMCLLEAQRPQGDPEFANQPGLIDDASEFLKLPPASREVGVLAAKRILAATENEPPDDWWISRSGDTP